MNNTMNNIMEDNDEKKDDDDDGDAMEERREYRTNATTTRQTRTKTSTVEETDGKILTQNGNPPKGLGLFEAMPPPPPSVSGSTGTTARWDGEGGSTNPHTKIDTHNDVDDDTTTVTTSRIPGAHAVAGIQEEDDITIQVGGDSNGDGNGDGHGHGPFNSSNNGTLIVHQEQVRNWENQARELQQLRQSMIQANRVDDDDDDDEEEEQDGVVVAASVTPSRQPPNSASPQTTPSSPQQEDWVVVQAEEIQSTWTGKYSRLLVVIAMIAVGAGIGGIIYGNQNGTTNSPQQPPMALQQPAPVPVNTITTTFSPTTNPQILFLSPLVPSAIEDVSPSSSSSSLPPSPKLGGNDGQVPPTMIPSNDIMELDENCTTGLLKADTDPQDGTLTIVEFVNFTKSLRPTCFSTSGPTNMPLELHVVFLQSSCDCSTRQPGCCQNIADPYIPIHGTTTSIQPPPPPLVADLLYLQQVCTRTQNAIVDVCGTSPTISTPTGPTTSPPPPSSSTVPSKIQCPTPSASSASSSSFTKGAAAPEILVDGFIDIPACYEAMTKSDVDGNDELSLKEYVSFVQHFGQVEDFVSDTNDFWDLPCPLIMNFDVLACLCKRDAEDTDDDTCCSVEMAHLELFGSKPHQQPTVDQSSHLFLICSLTSLAMDRVLSSQPPTTSPTGR